MNAHVVYMEPSHEADERGGEVATAVGCPSDKVWSLNASKMHRTSWSFRHRLVGLRSAEDVQEDSNVSVRVSEVCRGEHDKGYRLGYLSSWYCYCLCILAIYYCNSVFYEVAVIVDLLFVGGEDGDQMFIDVRMKAIRRKIVILSGKGGKRNDALALQQILFFT